ncbi:MAG TPA: hypothetical protein VJS45_01845 [Acidimicrobiia bacterium]|nr:hypothetical protein [Acidimicrobiia bacterium]
MDDVSWGIGPVGCRVDVYVRGRMLPQSTDYWDGNWLESDIVVDVGAFHGKIAAALRVDELQRFRKELEVLYLTVAGSAHLASLEEWITLDVKVDPWGHLTVNGEVRDRPGMGNRLLFHIAELDQTDLPPVIEGLTAIEAAYPILDQPD